MRKDAIRLEESRVAERELPDFPLFKERHRVFPAVFEQRNHKRVLDLAAGIGYVTQRLMDDYPATVVSHDISPSCLKRLRARGAATLCFDLDNAEAGFPFPSGSFDAVISLVTIEHLLFVDEFLAEIRRVLCADGYLYISTPNYAAFEYLAEPVLHGRTFHNPTSPAARYEFYAHVRYFTFKSLGLLLESNGFSLDSVYIALPEGSDRFNRLRERSRLAASTYRSLMWLKAMALPLSRAVEPILCLQKTATVQPPRFRKVIL